MCYLFCSESVPVYRMVRCFTKPILIIMCLISPKYKYDIRGRTLVGYGLFANEEKLESCLADSHTPL